MNWILPDADPSGLPAAAWLLQALLVFTFAVHVVVMNVALGGGAVSAATLLLGRSRTRRGDGEGALRCQALAHEVVSLLPVASAFTITTGVAPLLFLQVLYGQLFYSSSVLMAWPWLAIVPLLLVGYYAHYGLSFALTANETDKGGVAWLRRMAPAIASIGFALFVIVGFTFTNNMTLMLRPDRFAALYAASDAGLHTNVGDLWVWPRFAHMLVGALAVAGLVIGLVGRARERRGGVYGGWIAGVGSRLFVGATLLQVVVGILLFLSLPTIVRRIFLQGGPETMVIATALVFAIIALLSVRRSVVAAAIALVVTIADMAIVRDMVRRLTLVPYFSVDELAVRPQTTVMVVFLVLLVAGLATVTWMVRAVGRSRQ